jgi:hypothetical protein
MHPAFERKRKSSILVHAMQLKLKEEKKKGKNSKD